MLKMRSRSFVNQGGGKGPQKRLVCVCVYVPNHNKRTSVFDSKRDGLWNFFGGMGFMASIRMGQYFLSSFFCFFFLAR